MTFAQALIASDLSVSWEAQHVASRGQRMGLASLGGRSTAACAWTPSRA